MLNAAYLPRRIILYHVSLFGLVLALSPCVTGCTKSSNPIQATKRWVVSAPTRSTTTIASIPTVPSGITSTYRFNPNQDPFVLTKSSIAENIQTPSTLTAYPLRAYTMVGSLMQGTRIWGLVALPHGDVVKVTVGDFLGQEDGQVSTITATAITITEKNSTSDSLQDKTVRLTLNS